MEHSNTREIRDGVFLAFGFLLFIVFSMLFQPWQEPLEYATGATTRSLYCGLVLLIIALWSPFILADSTVRKTPKVKKNMFVGIPFGLILMGQPILAKSISIFLLMLVFLICMGCFTLFYKTKEERMSEGAKGNLLAKLSSVLGIVNLVVSPLVSVAYLLWSQGAVEVEGVSTDLINIIGIFFSAGFILGYGYRFGGPLYGLVKPFVGKFSDNVLENKIVQIFELIVVGFALFLSATTEMFTAGLVFIPVAVCMIFLWLFAVGQAGKAVDGEDEGFLKESGAWTLLCLAGLFFVTNILPVSVGTAVLGWLTLIAWAGIGLLLVKFMPDSNVKFSLFGLVVMSALIPASLLFNYWDSQTRVKAERQRLRNGQLLVKLQAEVQKLKASKTATPAMMMGEEHSKKTNVAKKKASKLVLSKKSFPVKTSKAKSPVKKVAKTSKPKKRVKKPKLIVKKQVAKPAKVVAGTSKTKKATPKTAKVSKTVAKTIIKKPVSSKKRGALSFLTGKKKKASKKSVPVKTPKAKSPVKKVAKASKPKKGVKKPKLIVKKSVTKPSKVVVSRPKKRKAKVSKKTTKTVVKKRVVKPAKVIKKSIDLTKFAYVQIRLTAGRLARIRLFSLYDDESYPLGKAKYYNDSKNGRFYISKESIEEYDLTHIKVGRNRYKIIK